jgi:hypothetical protein
MLREIRKGQLADRKASNERLQECDDLFSALDNGLSGVASDEALQEAMTSGDFTYAIQEFVSRKALPAYQRKQFNFEPLVMPDTVTNYMPVTRYQNRSGVDDMEWVGEKATARPGYVRDATKRQWQVWRWEKQFDFSQEAIKNDDIGYFENTAELMGQAARRTLERFVSRMYRNATSILRLTSQGALYSQNGRITTARISEARMAFNQRTDANGDPINAQLKYIVHHSGLTDAIAQIQASTLVPELATNAANVVKGTFTPIEDPYIAGTAPNLPWWAFVDWRDNNIIPFVLARLEGWTGPRIVRKRSDIESVTALLGPGAAVEPAMGDFDTGNIVLKVTDVFGTYVDGTEGNLVDYRGAYYSSGTAM